jgi:KEOPS complex subunit Pcc1
MRLEDVLQRAAEREEGRQGAMTMRRATIAFAGPEARLVYDSLRPEAGRDVPKARVRLRSERGRTTLTIDADDTGALRAAVNSYLRWADVAARVRREVIP